MEHYDASHDRVLYLRQEINALQSRQNIWQEKLDASGGEDHEALEKLVELQTEADSVLKELTKAKEEVNVLRQEYAMARAKKRRIIGRRPVHGRSLTMSDEDP